MKKLALLALASLIATAATTASAQFRKPEDAIKYRQSVMTVQGRAFYGSIGGMASGRTPFDPKVAADSAELVAMLAKLPWTAWLHESPIPVPLVQPNEASQAHGNDSAASPRLLCCRCKRPAH